MIRLLLTAFVLATFALALPLQAQEQGQEEAQKDDYDPPDINSEVTFDGLVKVKNARFQYVWAKPDIDFARYTKIMPGQAVFQFRAVRGGSTYRARSSQTEFPISDKDKQKLVDTVEEIFNEELVKSKYFTGTEEPGYDVLIIQGALIDIISRVPPEPVGRSDIYLDNVGEATLVIELSDSMSGEVLARAVERRRARPASGGLRSSPVTTWQEVRRLARRWARTLTEGLDSFHKD